MKERKAQAIIEYALIIALIAVLLIGVIGLLQSQIETVFTNIASALN